MPDSPGNGYDPPRFDQEHRKLQENHRNFQQGLKQLLTAQMVLTDVVEKVGVRVGAFIHEPRDRFRETDEWFAALIDDWRRRHPPP